jgi:hypothetical protein
LEGESEGSEGREVAWLTPHIEASILALHVILKGLKELGWVSTLPHADIINDITRANPILSMVANVVLETLGVQAAQVTCSSSLSSLFSPSSLSSLSLSLS